MVLRLPDRHRAVQAESGRSMLAQKLAVRFSMNELLKALADSDREREAPASVEPSYEASVPKEVQAAELALYCDCDLRRRCRFMAVFRDDPPEAQIHPQIAKSTVVTPYGSNDAPVDRTRTRKAGSSQPAPREV